MIISFAISEGESPSGYSIFRDNNAISVAIVSQCICNALRDLVPFAQFKKREKHPWRSVTFRKVAAFFKLYERYQIA